MQSVYILGGHPMYTTLLMLNYLFISCMSVCSIDICTNNILTQRSLDITQLNVACNYAYCHSTFVVRSYYS